MKGYILQPSAYHYLKNEYEECQVTADEVIVEDGSRHPQWTGLWTHRGEKVMRLPNPLGFRRG